MIKIKLFGLIVLAAIALNAISCKKQVLYDLSGTTWQANVRYAKGQDTTIVTYRITFIDEENLRVGVVEPVPWDYYMTTQTGTYKYDYPDMYLDFYIWPFWSRGKMAEDCRSFTWAEGLMTFLRE